jgi:hypothetical protein
MLEHFFIKKLRSFFESVILINLDKKTSSLIFPGKTKLNKNWSSYFSMRQKAYFNEKSNAFFRNEKH